MYKCSEDGFIRLGFVVGIAYEDRLKEAQHLIVDTVRRSAGVFEDENHETFVIVDELAVSTVNIKVYFWVETLEFRKESLQKRGDVVANVKEAILANGMHMPADINEIKLYDSQSAIPIIMNKEE